jgi:hypothetical protein
MPLALRGSAHSFGFAIYSAAHDSYQDAILRTGLPPAPRKKPSITGGWLAYILGTRPDVQDKMLAEIDAITGGDPLRLARLFGISDGAAIRYCTQISRIDKDAGLPPAGL